LYISFSYFRVSKTMNQTNCCLFCQSPHHSICDCASPLIESTFKQIFRSLDNICKPELDMVDTLKMLDKMNTYTAEVLTAISIKITRTSPDETRMSYHISKILKYISLETLYFSQLEDNQRREYLSWLNDEIDSFNSDEEDSLFGGNDAETYEEFLRHLNEEESFDNDETDEELEELEGDIQPVELLYPPSAFILCLETQEQLNTPVECDICYNEKTVFNMDIFQCQHSCCHTCVMSMLKMSSSIKCPFCRSNILTIEVKDTDNYTEIVDKVY